MAHCDKCNVDFAEDNEEEVKQHKHEEAAPAEAAPAEESTEPKAEGSEEKTD